MRRDPQVSRYAASRLSPQRRRDDLQRMRDETFDVLVIGGGVTGVGAALDAASRGLSVALVEARDLAAGTSSRSSKLIHGGLRYLEQLEFGLVYEALRERGLLLRRLAPHLVRPVPFLVPLTAPVWQRAYYGAGVLLYDALATVLGYGRGLPWHRHLTRRGARRQFPSLREDVLRGAIRYFDGQVDDARYVVAMARTAASYGAAIATSTRVVGVLREAREVVGVRVRDMETREEFDVRARTVIAATGVWSDDISAMIRDFPELADRPAPAAAASPTGLRVRASKGIHLLVPRSAITGDSGLILRTASSVLFVIPWGGHWLIGTTDTDWTLDRAHPAASATDIDYLLSQVNQVLDRPLSTKDIEGVYAGLRPLLSGEDDATSKLAREHAVVEPMLGLMLVAGGKYTTYRVMATDVVDVAARRLGVTPRSRTEEVALLGAEGYAHAWSTRADLARRHGVPVGVAEHLLERYGTLTREVLALIAERPDLAVPLDGAPEYLAAEVAYAVLAEGAVHVDDVLTRRTRISIETPHRGVDSAEHTATVMGTLLDWDGAAREREVAHYLARVAAERESQRMPDDHTADAARLGAPDVRGYTPNPTPT
ncbi:MAG: glycerol-3-phosphate dehydrogenase/oxidase [Micromonosporaceae bacterium]